MEIEQTQFCKRQWCRRQWLQAPTLILLARQIHIVFFLFEHKFGALRPFNLNVFVSFVSVWLHHACVSSFTILLPISLNLEWKKHVITFGLVWKRDEEWESFFRVWMADCAANGENRRIARDRECILSIFNGLNSLIFSENIRISAVAWRFSLHRF